MSKIALCMLVKNGREVFEACLRSIRDVVDDIIVVVDGESEDGCDAVAESFGARIFRRELNDDFGSQRNYSFEQVTDDADWILWLDSDDYVPPESAAEIRRLADAEVDGDIDGFIFDYLYEFDQNGNVTTVLKRERLLRRSSGWRWRYEIHEACVPQKPIPNVQYSPTVKIVHKRHEVVKQTGDRDPGRNLRILERAMPNYDDDPRMLFYAGNEYLANGRLEDAERCYERVLEIETWKEQRYLSAYRLATIGVTRGDHEAATRWALRAIEEDYSWAESYCVLGDLAMHAEEWDKAIHYYGIARQLPMPTHERLLTFNPAMYSWYPILRQAAAHEKAGNYDAAIASVESLLEEHFRDDGELKFNLERLKREREAHRRDGLCGFLIVPGIYGPAHPATMRQAALARGLGMHGLPFEVSKEIERAVGKVAMVLDGSARMKPEIMSDLMKLGTDIVIDICDEGLFDSEEFCGMAAAATMLTVNSPRLLERGRRVNQNTVLIHDAPLNAVDRPAGGGGSDLNVMVAISDGSRERADIIPLLTQNLEGVRFHLHYAGESDLAELGSDHEVFMATAKMCDFGVCYLSRDDEATGTQMAVSMMAMGLPVIASGNTASVSLIDHGHNGFIAYNPTDWVTYISTLAYDPAARRVMAERAVLKARSRSALSFANRFLAGLGVVDRSLDVIIPCHGKPEYLELCLRSLVANSALSTKFIVVSNAVEGREVDEIRRLALATPRCTYLDRDFAASYANNCNHAITTASDARYICLLNNDTIPTPLWDVNLVSVLAENERSFVATYSNGEYGWLHSEVLVAGEQQLVNRHRLEDLTASVEDIWELGRGLNERHGTDTSEVPWVTSGALAMSRETIREVGLLDEALKDIHTDVDYCRRLRQIGGRALYAWGAFVFHFCGTTRDEEDGGKDSPERKEQEEFNQFHLSVKETNGRRLIRFFVGPSWEQWLPEDIDRGGIGGSETCVAQMARFLSELGWTVEVYTNIDRITRRGGVSYVPYQMFDPHSHCDVLIVSRIPHIFDYDAINADLRVLYNHDAAEAYGAEGDPNHLSGPKLDKIDLIFVLSQWHRSQFGLFFPEVPAEKYYVTRNGIDTRRFERFRRGFIAKDPLRFVYSSSADRGLENLLRMWSTISSSNPHMRLHLYYGLDTWLKIAERRGDPKEFERIKAISNACKQRGIVVHGRVGQGQLAEEFAMSNLWLYPTDFTETSCITAMETAACGVRAITSPLAALNETAALSDFIDVGEATSEAYARAFIQKVAERLRDPAADERRRAMQRAWEWYDWRLVAAEWSDLFSERLEQRRLERTKSSSQAETDVAIVVPYGWSGGVQYPLELGREFARRGLRVKKWMVSFGGEADLSPHLPADPDFEVVDFQTFRSRADEVLDTKNVIVVNWQTHEALRAIGADAVPHLNRINLVQGDERKWAPVERIASMMNDSMWQIVYASKYLADTMQVPGRIIADGIPADTLAHGDTQDRDESRAGLLAHASAIKNTDVIIKASAEASWPRDVNLIVLAGEEAERRRIEAMPEWTAEVGAGTREVRSPLAGDMFSRDEVLAAMGGCGYWFVPSLEEGFGLVGLEAMACGCCVLTSAVGGMVTYTNRHNAVAVRNLKSPDAWARSLSILHAMPPGERETMRQLARSTADGYTIDRTADTFLREVIRQ